MSNLDGYNSDIKSEQVGKLAELFPEAVREGKVDFDALRATLGEDIEYGEKYGLGWKGKSGVFAKIQEKTVSTLHPQPDESVDWDTTQNMFIEGDNLEALKVLHKAYYGKIKMIYIDPPYNTGNDFVYNDDFAKTLRQNAMDEGLLDEEGNTTRDDGLRVNTGGHKHSNWLDMMYPRLFLARNLLRQDGVIFVSIDDNEVHNLRLMMNEIFGEENFISQITVVNNIAGRSDKEHIALAHEYLLVYQRSDNFQSTGLPLSRAQLEEYRFHDEAGVYRKQGLRKRGSGSRREDRPNMYYPLYVNPEESTVSVDNDGGVAILPRLSDGSDGRWRWGVDTTRKRAGELLVEKSRDGAYTISEKVYLEKEGVTKTTKMKSYLLDGKYTSDIGTQQAGKLLGKAVFDSPKSTELLKDIVRISAVLDEEIVFDFFGGSGTLAQAVQELNLEDNGNRKWAMVQLPELTDEKSKAYEAGYRTIADISRERIRRAGTKINKDFVDKIAGREAPLDLGFRSYVLGDSNFKKWNEQMREVDEIRQATLDQLNPIEDGANDNDLLTEILLKRGISPLVEMETHEDFIFIPSETLAISLSRQMTEELFAAILAKSPSQIILVDQAFRDDVNLKTNLVLQAEKQGVTVGVL